MNQTKRDIALECFDILIKYCDRKIKIEEDKDKDGDYEYSLFEQENINTIYIA